MYECDHCKTTMVEIGPRHTVAPWKKGDESKPCTYYKCPGCGRKQGFYIK